MQSLDQLSCLISRFRPSLRQKSRLSLKKKTVWLSLHQRPSLVAQLLTLMFGPSLKKNYGTMTSADFCRLMPRHSRIPRLRLSQISPGKNADLHPMYPPYLPPCDPGSGRASFCFANSPSHYGLVYGFCSSGRDFAAGFLQIPPRGGHPCLWLILLAAKRIADSNRRVCARAGRTKNRSTTRMRHAPELLLVQMQVIFLEIDNFYKVVNF